MKRYSPSKKYKAAGAVALALALFSGWCAWHWAPSIIPAVLFLLSSAMLFFLSFRPVIVLEEAALVLGKRAIPWEEIRRVDRTGWISPLVVHLTLADNSHVVLVYPGDLDSSNSLLRHLRRSARHSLIDGVPYKEFWAEISPLPVERKRQAAPRYPLLSAEDEAEVERLYQRLKTVGNLDSKNTPPEES